MDGMKRVLVTGFGFIGRHVVRRLTDEGYEVAVLERKPDMEALRQAGADPIVGDIRDAELLRAVVPEFDGVIHLAALLGTSELISDPASAVHTNIVGAINVFAACHRGGQLGRRVPCVHITAASYFMNNPYAITKRASERFAEMYNAEHGADIRVVRAQNVYGEFQKHYPVQKILPKFIRAALESEPLTVYGSGEQIQDMIYVGDVARILVAALIAPSQPGLISAGTGRRLTVQEIARMVIESTGSQSTIRRLPMRAGEPPGSVVVGDPSTLVAIGIDPASLSPLEAGLRRTIDWYRANRSYLG